MKRTHSTEMRSINLLTLSNCLSDFLCLTFLFQMIPKKSSRQNEIEPIGHRSWPVYQRCMELPEPYRRHSQHCQQLMEKLSEMHTIEVITTSDRDQVRTNHFIILFIAFSFTLNVYFSQRSIDYLLHNYILLNNNNISNMIIWVPF